ncbi:MAG: BON domain-containing protein [Planctomycetota bacterium]
MSTRHWIAALAVSALLCSASAEAQTPANNNRAVAQQIANEIHNSGQLSNYRVNVKFKDGVALLTGSVTDQAQANAAMRLARRVSGVNQVLSELEVAPAKLAKPAKAPAEANSGLLLQLADDGTEEQPVARRAAYEPQPMPAQMAPSQPIARRQPMRGGMPVPFARTGQAPIHQAAHRNVRPANYGTAPAQGYAPAGGMGGASGVSYDSPNMPGYAWPSYASHPNYSAVTYPRQYSPTAWPYIGPFYPYPQVPLGWRKVALEWDDGWWFLDFSHHQQH